MNWRRSLLLLSSISTLVSCGNGPAEKQRPDSPIADTLISQTDQPEMQIIRLGNGWLDISAQRPSKTDTSVFLCIAGAFTQLDNDKIDGLFMVRGDVIQPAVNHSLGGVLYSDEQSVRIFGSNDGKLLTQAWIDSMSDQHVSLLQQIQLVRNGKKLDFHKDQKYFQRRAIVIFKDGETAMIASRSTFTLDQFAQQLEDIDVQDAIYADMGDWDEGWYRDQKTGEAVTIGTSLASTDRQSNWLIFRK